PRRGGERRAGGRPGAEPPRSSGRRGGGRGRGRATSPARPPIAKRIPGPRTRTRRASPLAGSAKKTRRAPGETRGARSSAAGSRSSGSGSVTDEPAVERPGGGGVARPAHERASVAEEGHLAPFGAELEEELVAAEDLDGVPEAGLDRAEVEIAVRARAHLDGVPSAERRGRPAPLAAEELEAALPAGGAVGSPRDADRSDGALPDV